MAFELMKLPFDETALEPHISAETVQYHYGKHHQGYVNKLNSLILGTIYAESPLINIIREAEGPTFNNAAQVFNHDFYWHGLSPEPTEPSVELSDMITRDFGSMAQFKEAFLGAAAGLFGSGWAWLVLSGENKLVIEQTSNADTPIRYGRKPLLVCDVWEHAYYIDRRNARPDYLENWWKLVNWHFVSDNLAAEENDPIVGYAQPCNENNEVCDYVDTMQENEKTAT